MKEIIGIPIDKNVDDFKTISDNLFQEGHFSRSEGVWYLIERIKYLENICHQNNIKLYQQ